MRRSLPILAVTGAVALIALLAYGLTTHAANHSLDDAVAQGRYPAAPSLSLPGLAAGSGSVAALRGVVVVLNFWASWCVPCQAEAPVLQGAQAVLRAHRGTVLGVTYRDASPDSEAFIRRYGLSYPQLRDVDGRLAQAYGTQALPESFLIDRAGHVRAISRGEVSGGFVREAEALATAAA